ncbi:MAG: thioredoxin-disulfide reductase [Bdellovibrionales bacterium RIFOXYD12_FULL_39_22]|nr:MAG: thioredoxin-disulfide reductase [Bdellovibrionales bacterium RIFOXYB1_FULL_39_21]OFZ43850.1 MAG: thioredoxin-disulfide reductase [Bdellovibrionales bacterium RIFOXYC12_FULL_39_17]OFZ48816.1 MAG: thioredoxin-disulfide reductase [Bdellovibrionales bacterium RIFOXYC1_FULL_39_130]OFZ71500.1 MAG: thioredoxin-disulfide reductase [Bdellovibrionales bacterium RIFOXYC2_FULL_39_8]OFZ76549.1 MAG: thioredoxin-disulfide reductase [Bdellovibrionales bacterium RIFOXYD1_FULL_39_84]OFZ94783.1 MAG: thio
MNSRNCIIVGTGPAGYTAAIYAARANLAPLIIEGNQPGGQLTTTTEVENFPGFPNGIDGPQLMENMRKQATRFGAEFMATLATSVDLKKYPFKVTLEDGQTITTKSLIVATGASAKYLGIPHEKELIGKGVSACATCDGFFYRNKIVHIVGGGDTAMEEATFLTKFASKVFVIHRRDSLKASKAMQERAFSNPKIEFLWNSTVSKILFDQAGVTGIELENLKDGSKKERKTDGLFMAIGHQPNTNFLNKQLALDDHGFIKTHEGPYTSVEGVFACGDVQDPHFRQAISAAGSGCMAAIAAERFISSKM